MSAKIKGVLLLMVLAISAGMTSASSVERPSEAAIMGNLGETEIDPILYTAEEAEKEQQQIVALLAERFPSEEYKVSVTPICHNPLTTLVSGFEVKVESQFAPTAHIESLHGIFSDPSEVIEILKEMEKLETLGAYRVKYNGPEMEIIWKKLNVTGCNEEECRLLSYDIWRCPSQYVFISYGFASLSEEQATSALPPGFTFSLNRGWFIIFSPGFSLPETAEELTEIKARFNRDLDDHHIIPDLRF